jgi:hypothetical protein
MEDTHLEPQRRRIDIVTDPEYLTGLEQLETSELRSRRATCSDLERELSYYRRMLHGRIDLLGFERRRRRGEDERSLLEALPEILGDAPDSSARGHLTIDTADVLPPETPVPGRRSIDFVLGDDFLAGIGDVDDPGLDAAEATLRAAEREVSRKRRDVHTASDALDEEIERRYRAGLTSVDELLHG